MKILILLEYTQEEKEKEANLSLSVTPFDYWNFIREVEARQKLYFSQNIPELIEKIKASALVIIKVLKDTTPKLSESAGKTLSGIFLLGYKFTFPSNNNILRKELLNAYESQLDLIKEKAPEHCEEIIKFIDDTLEASIPIKIRTYRTDKLVINRSKPYKAIRDGEKGLYSEEGLIVETGHKKEKPVYTPVLLNYIAEELRKEGLKIESIGYINPFDMEILMHAESLYEAKNKYFTVDMLATQMTGGRRTQATPKFRELVYESLMRLRVLNVTISTDNEVKAGYNKKIIFSGAILPNKIEGTPIILNGKEYFEEYIYILDKSPLWKYADSKNQISRPPVNMLDVPASLTRENVMLVGYLTQRIIDMQSPEERRGKHIIRYDTIFEYLKIKNKNDNSTLTKKKRIRQTVRAILEEWKRKGIINDFQELGEDDKPPKSRAPIAKIKITLPQKKIESAKNNQ